MFNTFRYVFLRCFQRDNPYNTFLLDACANYLLFMPRSTSYRMYSWKVWLISSCQNQIFATPSVTAKMTSTEFASPISSADFSCQQGERHKHKIYLLNNVQKRVMFILYWLKYLRSVVSGHCFVRRDNPWYKHNSVCCDPRRLEWLFQTIWFRIHAFSKTCNIKILVTKFMHRRKVFLAILEMWNRVSKHQRLKSFCCKCFSVRVLLNAPSLFTKCNTHTHPTPQCDLYDTHRATIPMYDHYRTTLCIYRTNVKWFYKANFV